MNNSSKNLHRLIMTVVSCTLLIACASVPGEEARKDIAWQDQLADNSAHQRHENAFVAAGGKYYLMGGRGLKPIDIYDPAGNRWSKGKQPPFEIHHFQAIEQHGLILVLGALSGAYPYENPVANILIYDPLQDQWMVGPEIPSGRLRGAAGVAALDNRLYLVSGIVNGHQSGWVPWLDEFDLRTNQWRQLADAPRSRDHFQAGIIGKHLIAAGGRKSGFDAEMVFGATVRKVDVFNLDSEQWSTLPETADFPTPRAGTAAAVAGGKLVIAGGESPSQIPAHAEVDALDLEKQQWQNLPSLNVGRHGTQLIATPTGLVIAGGSGNRGGNPELVRMEYLRFASGQDEAKPEIVPGTLVAAPPKQLDDGSFNVELTHNEGNQALVIGHALVLGNGQLTGDTRFPFLLLPGETLQLSITNTKVADALPGLLMVKTLQQGVPPLEIRLDQPK